MTYCSDMGLRFWQPSLGMIVILPGRGGPARVGWLAMILNGITSYTSHVHAAELARTGRGCLQPLRGHNA